MQFAWESQQIENKILLKGPLAKYKQLENDEHLIWNR